MERPRGAASVRRMQAAVLAAIQAYAGAPDGSLRIMRIARIGGGDQWRLTGRRELMGGRGRVPTGRWI